MAKVKVVLASDWEQKIQSMDGLKRVLSSVAWAVASKATASSAAFLTERTTNWETGEKMGGKSPLYLAKDARMRGGKAVAIVYTGNYAAAKDNTMHNTLLKSK